MKSVKIKNAEIVSSVESRDRKLIFKYNNVINSMTTPGRKEFIGDLHTFKVNYISTLNERGNRVWWAFDGRRDLELNNKKISVGQFADDIVFNVDDEIVATFLHVRNDAEIKTLSDLELYT